MSPISVRGRRGAGRKRGVRKERRKAGEQDVSKGGSGRSTLPARYLVQATESPLVSH